MARSLKWCPIVVVLSMILLGCNNPRQKEESVELSRPLDPAENVLTAEISAIPGPKRTVALGNFTAIGSFKAQYGDMDIGGGLGSMMITALVESDRFIVIERSNINQVLAEQELKAQGLTKGSSAPDTGKLTGVQLLLYGSVTEFGESNKGGGFSIGVAGLVSASPQWAKGSIAMDIRVVDATTGEIVKNFKVSERVHSSGWRVSGRMSQISVGNNAFVKTPLGQAARRCITKAVEEFSGIAAKRPWEGRIVEAGDGTAIINAGARAGIRKGDVFKVMRVTKTFTDPETGQTLGHETEELGRIEVNDVQSKMSNAIYVPLSVEAPGRGDLVVVP